MKAYMPSDISRISDLAPYDFNRRRDYQILVREVLGIYGTPPGIDDLVDLLVAAPDREQQQAAAICLKAMGDGCIEPLYARAEQGDPAERALCLRTLTEVPDPDLGEKVEFLREVFTRTDDPGMKAAARSLSALSVRTVIPLLHLLRTEDLASSDLRATIKHILVEMGEVAIAPVIQFFRFDDRTYFESVLPVLRSLAPASVEALEAARHSDDQTIQKYAAWAIQALQGPSQGSRARKILTEFRDHDEWAWWREDDWDDCYDEDYDETAESMGYDSFWYENYDEVYDSMASR